MAIICMDHTTHHTSQTCEARLLIHREEALEGRQLGGGRHVQQGEGSGHTDAVVCSQRRPGRLEPLPIQSQADRVGHEVVAGVVVLLSHLEEGSGRAPPYLVYSSSYNAGHMERLAARHLEMPMWYLDDVCSKHTMST